MSPILVGMFALVSLGAFESLAVSTAMPVIARALDGMSLYAPAFALTIATSVVGMVLAGRSTDKGGTGPALIGGVAIFLAGLLVAGFTPSMELFLVGRVLQGLGSGAYIVALYVVVARHYEGRARAGVLAGFSAAWVVPSLIGPLISGFIVEHFGWQWVFLSVAILAVPATLLLLPVVRATAVPAAKPGHGRPTEPARRAEPGLPTEYGLPNEPSLPNEPAKPAPRRGAAAKGAVAWAVAAGIGVALMSLGSDSHDVSGYAMIAVGAALVMIFGPRLLPTGTMRAGRGLPTVIALRGLIAAAFLATEVYLPLILQHDRGFSPAESGIILTIGGVTWFAGSMTRSRLDRPNLAFLRVGTALVTAGIAIVALLVIPQTPEVVAMIGWALAGYGIGMTYPTLALLVFDLSPKNEQGSNTSSLQVSDSLTSSFFLAIAGILIAWLVGLHGPIGYLAGFGLTAALALLAFVISPRTVPLPDNAGTIPVADQT